MNAFAAELGLSAGDPYFIGLFCVGLALAAAIAALSYQSERAFSAAVIYLGLGLIAAAGLYAFDIEPLSPIADAKLVSKIAELALLIAVFTAGLKMERSLDFASWRSVFLLIVLVMPATVAAITAFGTGVMGLSLGAALILGGVLAATDPVLAGDIGVGAPGDQPREPEEPQFAITAEAGLNDGLSSPFVLLGILVAGGASAGDLAEWAAVDLPTRWRSVRPWARRAATGWRHWSCRCESASCSSPNSTGSCRSPPPCSCTGPRRRSAPTGWWPRSRAAWPSAGTNSATTTTAACMTAPRWWRSCSSCS